MIGYIILLWILIKMSAPVWLYILAGAGILLKAIKLGMDLKD